MSNRLKCLHAIGYERSVPQASFTWLTTARALLSTAFHLGRNRRRQDIDLDLQLALARLWLILDHPWRAWILAHSVEQHARVRNVRLWLIHVLQSAGLACLAMESQPTERISSLLAEALSLARQIRAPRLHLADGVGVDSSGASASPRCPCRGSESGPARGRSAHRCHVPCYLSPLTRSSAGAAIHPDLRPPSASVAWPIQCAGQNHRTEVVWTVDAGQAGVALAPSWLPMLSW